MATTQLNTPSRAAVKPTQYHLNAQQVTAVAFAFLKSLGHKKGIKPKRGFLENQQYIVEAEIGKTLLAKVQINSDTSEITEYSIEVKQDEEGSQTFPLELKPIIVIFGISILVSLLFALLDLQSFLRGLL